MHDDFIDGQTNSREIRARTPGPEPLREVFLKVGELPQ